MSVATSFGRNMPYAMMMHSERARAVQLWVFTPALVQVLGFHANRTSYPPSFSRGCCYPYSPALGVALSLQFSL